MFSVLAKLLAAFYSLTNSYAGAITLWTLAVMLVLAPLTVKGTRSMLAMQRLAPELKKLQELHKNDRVRMNEEVQKVYKDNHINPLGGCLPTILPLIVFIIVYRVVSGITKHSHGIPKPGYISHDSSLYKDIVAAAGKMESFGIDLASHVTSNHGSFGKALPFYVMLVLYVGLQYFQMAQMTRRMPAPDTPQAIQMRKIQQFLPLFLAFICLNIPAAVILYFIVSAIFRIAQQTIMYRYDPQLKSTVAAAEAETEKIIKQDRASSPRAQKAPGRPTNKNNNNAKNKKRKGR